MFCFLCGRFDHRESFYLVQMVKGSKEMPFGWGILLKAITLRAMIRDSIWLREPRESWGGKFGDSNLAKRKSVLNDDCVDLVQSTGNNLGINFSEKSRISSMDEEIVDVIINDGDLNEDRPMLVMNRKK